MFTDAETKQIVSNVLNHKDGFKFVLLLLDKLGAFERGYCFGDAQKELFNRSKREQGLWLHDLVADSNIEKFIEILNERKKENGK